LLALKMLLGESPKVSIPGGKRLRIILQHSLYTLLNSKTEADQGVLKLVRKGVLMRLHSPCDGAIILVLKSEYRAYVSRALKGSMTPDELGEFLTLLDGTRNMSTDALEMGVIFAKDKSKIIRTLISNGVLRAQSLRLNGYWFSFPGCGPVFTDLTLAWKKIRLRLKKARFKEAFRDELEKKILGMQLRLSPTFIMRHLIGSEKVVAVQTHGRLRQTLIRLP
jgi:hypothetical protein